MLLAGLLDILDARREVGIVAFHRTGEVGIALGIFMRAIDQRIIGQRTEFLQGLPHLLAGAFEQSAAAQREQRIAAKERMALGKPIGDMAYRMARHIHHHRRRAAEQEGIAVADFDIDTGNALGILAVADDDGPRRLLQRHIAADMVVVMMRVEDMSQPPTLGLQPLQHRRSDGRVDDRGRAAIGVMRQIDVIVVENGNLLDSQFGHGELLVDAGGVGIIYMFHVE